MFQQKFLILYNWVALMSSDKRYMKL